MKIHLLGDSLVQAGGTGFYSGWGAYLGEFFDENVKVCNYSVGGRSCRSFLNEGRLYANRKFGIKKEEKAIRPALPEISEGDYVLISFICNDDDSKAPSFFRIIKKVKLGSPDSNGIYPVIVPEEKMLIPTQPWKEDYIDYLHNEGIEPDRINTVVYTIEERINQCGDMFFPYDCAATYKGYLKFYIDMVKKKGAVPILVTCGALHKFTDGRLLSIPGFHGGSDKYNDFRYVEAIKQLGNEENVKVIDLFAPTKSVYETLGEELSSYLHNINLSKNDRSKIDAAHQIESKKDKNWCSDYNKRRAERNFTGIDCTHSNRFGAFFQAALIADKLYELDMLKDYILDAPHKYEEMPERLIAEKAVFEKHIRNIRLFGRL